jgi:hypothetical protein
VRSISPAAHGQVAHGSGVADPLPGYLDRQPLLAPQPGGTCLGAVGLPHALGVPPRQHPCFGGVEPPPYTLQLEHRGAQLVTRQPIQVHGREIGQRPGGSLEEGSSVGVDCHDLSSFGHAISHETGTSDQVPKGKQPQCIELVFPPQQPNPSDVPPHWPSARESDREPARRLS